MSPGMQCRPLERREDGGNTVKLMRIKRTSGYESDCITLNFLNLLNFGLLLKVPIDEEYPSFRRSRVVYALSLTEVGHDFK